MPRGRKRKVQLDTAAEGMDVDAELANAEAGVENEQEESVLVEPKTEETGEETDEAEANDETEVAPSVDKMDLRKAQEELSTLDLHVCGKCHNVFHYLEEFQKHKTLPCSTSSNLFTGNTKHDSKAQVWAFVLYKAQKIRERGGVSGGENYSWELYQKWTQLDEPTKQSWVEAGRSLQQMASYLPQSPAMKTPIKLQQTKGKLLTQAEREQQQQTLMELQKELEDDTTETQMMSTLGLVRGKGRDDREQKAGLNQVWRKSLINKNADEDEEELYTIEKIVAKRVNPKTKLPEYLVKWVGFQSDNNTWEQVGNQGNCKRMVDEFEKNLARQKARKAQEQQNKLKIRMEDMIHTTPGGRPIRSSALKAMDQVKEWVGGKRALESDEGDDDEEPATKRSDTELMFKKKLSSPVGKSPLLLANSRGVGRLDPKTLPKNLASGVYILSNHSGLIKVDDASASKLASCMNSETKKIISGKPGTVMINETEVRKIPASQAIPKTGIIRKEFASGVMKKENSLSPNVNILKTRTVGSPIRAVGSGRGAPTHKILIGQPRATRPLPGPVISTLRLPQARAKTPRSVGRPSKQGGLLLTRSLRKEPQRKLEEDMDSSMTEEGFSKEDDSEASRSITLCSMSGDVIGTEGDSASQEDESMGDADEDGMMRVTVSPGGSIHQVVNTRQQRGKGTRSLLMQRRGQAEQQQEIQQEQEVISIEGEDGVIYQITPEQQSMLMQNGTLTMDKQDEANGIERTEIVFENGQIVERQVMSGEGDGTQDEQTMIMEEGKEERQEGETYNEEGVLTLDSAVQEAVSAGEQSEPKQDDGQQMVAQIVQAEPPTPGGGPRKVVLLLPDGSLLETEMEEEQYQALDFEK